jgi:CTP synthase
MQIAVVEFARDVLGLTDADSTEFNTRSKNPLIHIMETQKDVKKKGGTMRLGAYPCKIKPKTLAYEIYGETSISQRHRHRFEFNNKFREKIEKAGMKISGTSPNNLLVEIVEIPSHPFFIAGQFHPEFKSRPDRPEPLFRELVKAAKKAKYSK